MGRERTLKVKITDQRSGTGFKDAAADAEGFRSKLRTTGSKLRSFGTQMSTFVTLPLAAGGMAAVNMASDLNESLSKSDTIFKGNASQIRAWAETAATSFGQSKQEAAESAATFGNLFTQVGIGTDAAADMSTTMVELASDFASFHNANPVDVIDAQTAAFRGEYDALQRFVPTINAAAVEQKALAQTGKDVASELTAGEKAAATYALMMEGAGEAVGDFDRTSDSAANQQRVLKAKFADTAAELGTKLLPIFQKLVGWLTQAVDWFNNLSPGWQQFIVYAGLAAAVLGPLLIFLGMLATAIAAITLPMLLWVAAIAAVIAIVALLIIYWDDLRAAVGAAWDWIIQKLNAAWTWIKTKWGEVVGSIKGGITSAKDWIVGKFNAVVTFVTDLPTRIRNAASGMWNGIKDAFKNAINSVIGIWNNFRFPKKTFDIPSISVMGRKFGGGSFSLGGWSLPQITPLAEGGIVQATPGGILANIGEGKHDEAVIPLKPGMDLGVGATEVVIDMRGAIVADARQFEQMVIRAFRRASAKGVPITFRGAALA